MGYDELPEEIKSIMGSSNAADLQKKENFYREKYGTAEIDSIPDPRADPKPSIKPEGAPKGTQQETEDYYKRTYGFGSIDDEGAPQQQHGEIPPDHIPTVRQAFGDQYQTDYAACAKFVQDRFGDNREQFSRLEQAVVAEIGEVEALKLLRKLAGK